MWSTFSSTPLNAEEHAGLSVEFQIKERIDTTDDTTDDDTPDDTTPSQSGESLQTGSERGGGDTGEDEPGDVTSEVPGTTGHIELRVSGFCAFRSLAVGLVHIYIVFFSVCPRCDSHCSPQASCVFAH